MHHAQIAQRAFNTPLMVDPAKALAFLSGLGPRISGQEIVVQGEISHALDRESLSVPARATLLGGDLAEHHDETDNRPFTLIDGIAVIEITGTLVHRGAWIGQSSGATSYEGITAQLDAALADMDVRGIALDIDSFGGEVAGAFDLADRIRAARDHKPVHAFVAEHALSAGYVLAAQASKIIVPRTGAVGSIGVVMLHTEMSRMLENKGVTVTLVHSGAHKIDGNPYQPLADAVHAHMLAELQDLRLLFAQTVAKGRGSRLDEAAALATEAAIIRGVEAVTRGLADTVSDPRTAFRAFVEDRRDPSAIAYLQSPVKISPSPTTKETTMTTNSEPAVKADSQTPVSQGQVGATPQAATEAPVVATQLTATIPATQQSTSSQATSTAPSHSTAPPVHPHQGGNISPAPINADAIRAEAADVAHICAQAARLGVPIDTADAVKRGLKPEALRSQVLDALAARSDAAVIVATAPSPEASADSPIIAAAKKAASEAAR